MDIGAFEVSRALLLLGTNPTVVECHTAFVDPGAAVSGCPAMTDLKKIARTGVVDANTPGSYLLTYVATNEWGEFYTTNRTVLVVDTQQPLLSLLGDNPLVVPVGTALTDPGATATDTCAGDRTAAIQVSGAVETNVLGSYTLTYQVGDGNGNTASSNRLILVADKPASSMTRLILNGSVNPNGQETRVFFQFGSTAAYGHVALATNLPIGFDPSAVHASIEGLVYGQPYHYRLVASNSLGVVFGPDCLTVVGNTPPQLSDFLNQTTMPGTTTPAIPFTVGDNETDAGALLVQVAAANPLLVPPGGLVLGGSGPSRNLAITPAAGQRGHSAILVSVSDGAAVTTKGFTLAVENIPGDTNGDGMVDQGELDVVLTNHWPYSPWLVMTNPACISSNTFQFALTNFSGWNLSVLASTNFETWEYVAPAFPLFQFLDPEMPANPARFYRLRWP